MYIYNNTNNTNTSNTNNTNGNNNNNNTNNNNTNTNTNNSNSNNKQLLECQPSAPKSCKYCEECSCKMLHIRWKCRFQLKNAAKSMENGQNMLQTVANTVENTMENERFELKTVAHTVEMAVSSSKMLQIAWKMVRTGNPKKIPKLKKKSPNNFLPNFKWLDPCSIPGAFF